MKNNKGDLALNAFVTQRRVCFADLLRQKEMAVLNQKFALADAIDAGLENLRKMFKRYEKMMIGGPTNGA